MEPATAIIIASLIGSAIAGGSSGYQTYKTGQFNKQQKKFAESESKKQELAARREALARAIKAGEEKSFLDMPRSQASGPEAPNFTGSNIIGGVGQAGAQAAMQYFGNKMQPGVGAGLQVAKPQRYDYRSNPYAI